ncbi:MAG: helix-turn-helix transcriptional regulator [Lentisphaerae bacterium]|nr:helix-turn-helix transcriptional regulator [Lentisphaerota bacterium]
MNYFDGIKFIGRSMIEHHQAWYDRVFNGYYGIQYNHSGSLHLIFDDRLEFTVEGSWAFITWPGPRFQYGSCDGKLRSHNFVCFAGERAELFRETGLMPLNPEQPLIKIINPDRFMETMTALNKIPLNDRINYARAVSLLESLLLQLHEQRANMKVVPAHHEQKLKILIRQLRSSPQLEWDFNREAAGLFVSFTHFRRMFKQYTGLPPQQFLINCRLNLAVKMLSESSDSVAEIAARCGFDDVFYFSRIFKKHRNIAPLAYRKEFSISH